MFSARLTIDPRFAIGDVSRRLFGSFVEHLGRCVYDGLYEPGHETADAFGFRGDVVELVRELGVSTVRYPGGNFVSGYKWEDGVGPRDARPRRLELAWHSTETNQVGLHEFATWTELVGAELMLAVNLGTRGVAEALDLAEYALVPGGTDLSEQRRANGHDEPFAVRMWCLGNEMDGPWQLGYLTPDAYGTKASQTAKALRQLDPTLELVACGSSNSSMPTFGEWERVVLGHTYDDVDFISCHAYYQERDGDTAAFLASAVNMDHFIETVVATADHVGALTRSPKKMAVSFDEWNVWYQDRFESTDKISGIDNWPVAPRLLEDQYTTVDAVVVGNLLISLLKHADRVKAASLAQLVNVIAPIMTEPGGPAWRQTIFFPFATTSRLAQGTALDVRLEAPTYETEAYGSVPLIDAVATHDADSATTSLFLVNRSLDDEAEIVVDVSGLGDVSARSAQSLYDEDLRAANTLADQNRVSLRPTPTAAIEDGRLRLVLPPVSWTAVELA